MNEKHETKILRWEDVKPLFRYYVNIWPNDLSLRWARVAWQAVEECGLAVYSSQPEELTVRSYAVALSMVYYEYCHRANFHENPGFKYWNQEVLNSLKQDFSSSKEMIEETISLAASSLIDRLGDRETVAELWVNCIESSRGFPMSAKETDEVYRDFIEDFNDDFNYSNGQQFILGGIDDIDGFVSISGLGVFE